MPGIFLSPESYIKGFGDMKCSIYSFLHLADKHLKYKAVNFAFSFSGSQISSFFAIVVKDLGPQNPRLTRPGLTIYLSSR